MIFVDRSTVPRPDWFGSEDWGARMINVRDHFTQPASERSQRRIDDLIGPWPLEVMEALWRLFGGRCAMCESSLDDPSPTAIKRFRPIEIPGKHGVDRHIYAYAALLWENLLLFCPGCDRARGVHFDVDQPYEVLLHKMPTITSGRSAAARRACKWLDAHLAKARKKEFTDQMDPTRDEPAQMLFFNEDGGVSPNTTYVRAHYTVAVFDLNRTKLCEQRRKAIKTTNAWLETMPVPKELIANPNDATAYIDDHTEVITALANHMSHDFQATRATCLITWLESWLRVPDLSRVLSGLNIWEAAEVAHINRVLVPLWQLRGSQPKPEAQGTKKDIRLTPIGRTTGTVTLVPKTAPLYSAHRITRVRLRHFRQLDEVEFRLPLERPEQAVGEAGHLHRELRNLVRAATPEDERPPPEPDSYCGWKMLLGENGGGKSSILQAIALALIADHAGDASVLDNHSVFPTLRESLQAGQAQGSIEVWLEGRGEDQPVRLVFTSDGVSIDSGTPASEPKKTLYLRGYGACRLLHQPGDAPSVPADGTPQPQQADHLFHTTRALADPNTWLQSLDDESRRMAFITLKDLLDLPGDASLKYEDGTLKLTQRGHTAPLAWLSAGYQSVIALACDIMAGFGSNVADMQKRTGIILLDEIGTNLHPRWRLRIVQALRRAFPRLQFIASTHEPLCLRGLNDGEVCVLTQEVGDLALDTGATAQDVPPAVNMIDSGLPSPATLRVDQLLTSELFGLRTAYDPDEEAAFDAYTALLVQQRTSAQLTTGESDLLSRMREILPDRLALGGTAFERRILTAVEAGVRAETRKILKGSPRAQAAAEDLRRALAPGT